MKPKAFIFDFDGTLVHSNQLKREAFYNLSEQIKNFPEAVDQVLAAIPEKSRFEIITEIHRVISESRGIRFSDSDIQRAIESYNDVVRDGILACQELEGATTLLKSLRKNGRLIFISSNTPERFLPELVAARGWHILIDGLSGLPKTKIETIRRIMSEYQLEPSQVIVIGDGPSDEFSARETGCGFYRISHDRSLVELLESEEFRSHV